MTTHYDEKGKIFTDIITKECFKVNIQTTINRIEGLVYISQGKRLKDELNTEEKFLAVTDAKVFNTENTELYNVKFIAVNRKNIVWVFPVNADHIDAGETK